MADETELKRAMFIVSAALNELRELKKQARQRSESEVVAIQRLVWVKAYQVAQGQATDELLDWLKQRAELGIAVSESELTAASIT